MELNEYLQAERGRTARVARAVGLAPAYLSQMAAGRRPVPPALAPALAAACEYEVDVWDMRPEDWQQIWTHLVGPDGKPRRERPEAVAEPRDPPACQPIPDHLEGVVDEHTPFMFGDLRGTAKGPNLGRRKNDAEDIAREIEAKRVNARVPMCFGDPRTTDRRHHDLPVDQDRRQGERREEVVAGSQGA